MDIIINILFRNPLTILMNLQLECVGKRLWVYMQLVGLEHFGIVSERLYDHVLEEIVAERYLVHGFV